jgi:DNA-binding MltR family transcriptional regulator
LTDLIRGRALERYFSLNDALREFAFLFQEEKNERAAAIVGAAFLDTLLENILINFFIDDEKEVDKLLKPERPVGTYGSRVALAYCLGLIGKVIRDDLRLIGKIRNKFAHDLSVTFDDDPIRSWVLALKWHEISMMMPAPKEATPSDVFQVGVNQLATHLNGIVSIARTEKRQSTIHGQAI